MADLVPIVLTPQTIREAFVAQLIACNVAGGNIVGSRPRPTSSGDVPIVNVFSPGSDGDGVSIHLPRFETRIRIVCAATVVLPEGGVFADIDAAVANAIDAVELEIKTAILGDDIFAASFKKWAGIRVQKGLSTEGTEIRALVNIEFTPVYNEQYQITNKAGYPDFDRLDIETVSDGHARLVTHDGDRIVTHDGDFIQVAGAPSILCRPLNRLRIVTHDGDNIVTHADDQLVTHESTGGL